MARLHPDELRYQAEQVWQNKSFVTLLCIDDPSLTDTSSLGDWLENELLPINGYSRAAFTISGAFVYDSANREQDVPTPTATFSGSGSGYTYRTAITLRGGNTRSLIGTVSASSVNTSTDRITITSHGTVSGEAIVFHPVPGDTLPSPIVAGTRYYAAPFSANEIAVFSDAGLTVPVNLTTQGTGQFRVRNADGTVVAVDIAAANRFIAAGQSDAYRPLISQVGPA